MELFLNKPSKLGDLLYKITITNRRTSTKAISDIPTTSHGTVWNIRHQLGFQYVPPIQTLYLSVNQLQKRLEFCRYHLENNSDWTNVLFTNEIAFCLDHDHRWVRKRKG